MATMEELKMQHLAESTDELVAAVRASDADETRDAPPKPDPRDAEQWAFQFDWKDKRGKRWSGEFINKIIDIQETQQIAVIKSKMLGGVALASVSDEVQLLTGFVAHMSVSLTKKPDWAKDLRRIKDPALIYRLWAEVDSHESHYFRYGEDQEKGSSGSGA